MSKPVTLSAKNPFQLLIDHQLLGNESSLAAVEEKLTRKFTGLFGEQNPAHLHRPTDAAGDAGSLKPECSPVELSADTPIMSKLLKFVKERTSFGDALELAINRMISKSWELKDNACHRIADALTAVSVFAPTLLKAAETKGAAVLQSAEFFILTQFNKLNHYYAHLADKKFLVVANTMLESLIPSATREHQYPDPEFFPKVVEEKC